MANVINAIESPFDGIVSAFYFDIGELVSDGALLVDVTSADEKEA